MELPVFKPSSRSIEMQYRITSPRAGNGPEPTIWFLFPIYSMWISGLFLLLLPFRLERLRKSSIKVLPGHRGVVKALSTFILSSLQLSAVIVSCNDSDAKTFDWVSDVLPFLATIGIMILSFFEHRRSVAPSTSLSIFLLAFLAGDIIQLTTPKHQIFPSEIRGISMARAIVVLAIFILENQEKKASLRAPYQNLSPEELSGVLGRAFFWWIYPILRDGNRYFLVGDELPPLDGEVSTMDVRRKMLRAWDMRVKPEGKLTLPSVMLRCFKWPFLAAIPVRLFLITFRYSQAILINQTIRFINQGTSFSGLYTTGYLLILAAATVYVGMAISTAVYQHQLNRIKIMIRGGLIGMIYHRAMHVQAGAHEHGNAVALMSGDVANLETVAEMVHETWAQVLEVFIGMALLANQIGWLCPVPLVIILFCSQVSRYVATHLKGKQKNWSVATHKRIATTASMLSSIKSMKMLGLAETMSARIGWLRNDEIEMSKILRWMMVAYNASANALGIFSPAITLALFAIIWQYKGYGKVDTDTIFTTTAILSMVTHPANMIMTIIPRAVASLANFERVQTFLVQDTQYDSREEAKVTQSTTLVDDQLMPTFSTTQYAIIFEAVILQYPSTAKIILRNIDFRIETGSIVICLGPVGAGKTTLARAVLGELAVFRGSVYVSTRSVGYCAQIPWLQSGTIREVICGGTSETIFALEWYNAVVAACELNTDLRDVPHGEETDIGSRGINLSGGQRQRVALARALYSRHDILVLDDPFSSLDGKTEESIIRNLFGPEGLCKKMGTTVFMITHATQHFPLADRIIILGDSTIQAQGTWDELKNVPDQISKMQFRGTEKLRNESENEDVSKVQGQKQVADDAAIDLARKTGDIAIYRYYFNSIGYLNIATMVCCTALNTFPLTFSQYWLKMWTEASANDTWFYISGYLVLCLIAWFGTSTLLWAVYIKIAPRSGFVLHQRLLEAAIGAPLSYYFHTEIGVILNRFGQDIQIVDTQLPSALAIIVTQTCKLLAQSAILLAVQSMMLITLPFCIIIVYVVQKIYLRTSRQLRYIELESRSAVYSSFLETVEGISTIRAFGWQDKFENHNTIQIETSQRPYYILLSLQRWLNIVLDLLIAGIAVSVISIAVWLKGSTSGAQVGVALNLILVANTTLLKLVESWTTLEISLGAVARLKGAVEQTTKEDKVEEDFIPPPRWPSDGRLKLENVTVSYNSQSVALKNVTLDIQAGQKVTVCGRTGSGKSTLLLTLLHLLDLQSGTVTLDNINLSLIPRSIIRQRAFIAVPQDPFLFTDTSLRLNLDPSATLSDQTLIDSLRKTHLWKHFSSSSPSSIHPQLTSSSSSSSSSPENSPDELPKSTILSLPLSSHPPLSTGQTQLFSLSRALLRRNFLRNQGCKPVLLLDEATSSLDVETERVVQGVIEKEFTGNGYTVVEVAHRLGSLIGGKGTEGKERVVWMSEGNLVSSVEGDGVSEEEGE